LCLPFILLVLSALFEQVITCDVLYQILPVLEYCWQYPQGFLRYSSRAEEEGKGRLEFVLPGNPSKMPPDKGQGSNMPFTTTGTMPSRAK